jgi:hypothetical protein
MWRRVVGRLPTLHWVVWGERLGVVEGGCVLVCPRLHGEAEDGAL